jgi:hypothetical protein
MHVPVVGGTEEDIAPSFCNCGTRAGAHYCGVLFAQLRDTR